MFRKVVHAECVKPPPYDKLRQLNPTKFDDLITFEDVGHRYFYKGKQLTCRSISSLSKLFHGEENKMNLEFMSVQSSKMMYRKVCEYFESLHTSPVEEDLERKRKQCFETRLLVHLVGIEQWEQRILENKHKPLDDALDEVEPFLDSITPEQIRKNWNWSAQLGTDLHEYIEAKLNDVSIDIPHISVVGNKEYYMVNEFLNNCRYEPWRTELRIYSHQYNIVGSVDFVFVTRRDDEGNVVGVGILDWKRTHKIKPDYTQDIDYKANSKKRYLPPLDHMIPTTRNDYTIQQSTYAYVIESELGMKIDFIGLGVVHSDNEHMFVTRLPYLRKEVIQILETLT